MSVIALRRMMVLLIPSVAIAGCSGNSAGYGPQPSTASIGAIAEAHKQLISPAKIGSSNLFYVTNYVDGNPGQGQVLVYQKPFERSPVPLSTITKGIGDEVPNDPVLDAHGALYVPSGCSFSGTGGSVQVYAKGHDTPRETITDSINCPLGSAIDPAQNLYVSNVYVDGSSDYHGTVTVYPHGQTSPSETIQGPLKAPHGLALDSHQNLFIADPYAASSVGAVFEVAHGTTMPVPLNLNGLIEPIEVATDGSNNLYVSDNVANVVQIYAAGQTSPEVTLSNPNGGTRTYGICLDQKGHLFVIDGKYQGSTPPVINEYKDPLKHSAPLRRVFTQDLTFPDGCAAKTF